jgi:hypothetical protein
MPVFSEVQLHHRGRMDGRISGRAPRTVLPRRIVKVIANWLAAQLLYDVK